MRLLSASVLAGVLCAALPAMAQDKSSGEFLFFTFCSTCHGEAGKGDGPTAPALTIRPADLTGLTARNQGVFPIAKVIRRIEGTDPLMAHGGPMPLYGKVFDGAEPALVMTSEGEIATNVVVLDLIAWLEQIQE
jgi:mono/diheme cytochrome c family protein